MRVLLLALLCLLGPCLESQEVVELQPRILDSRDMMSAPNMPWRFRAGDDPAFAMPSLDDRDWLQVPFPSIPKTKLEASGWQGRGWFRVRFRLPVGWEDRPLGLCMDNSGAVEVWLDGRRVDVIGSLSPHRAEYSHQRAMRLEPGPGSEHLLALRYGDAALADPSRGLGRWLLGQGYEVGPGRSLTIRTWEAAKGFERTRSRHLTHHSLVVGGLLMGFGILHILFFGLNRRRRSALYFGLFAAGYGTAHLAFGALSGLADGVLQNSVLRLGVGLGFGTMLLGLLAFLEETFRGRPGMRTGFLGALGVASLGAGLLGWTAIPSPVFLAAGALLALFEAARALLLKLPGAGLLGGGILLAAAFPAVLALSRAAGGAPAWVFASVIFLGTVVLLLAFSAHLGRVHAGVVTELEVLNRGLEAKVAARTSELEEANARIASLSGRAREAAEDLEAWTRAMAVELAPALGAATLELWALGRDGASALTANPTLPLSADSVRSLAQKPVSFEDSADLIVPVLGLRGEPIGALVVRGRAAPWTATQTQLLQSLSSHLAGALDLRRLKLEALEAEARALASRQDLIDQGLEVLHTCPACGRCYPHTVAACTEDGLPLEPARAIAYRAGGRYRLVRILGRGAMGLVFEARDEELDRFVALKVILPEHFSQPEYRQRFEQEAWALARMNHPGILAVHDRGSLPDGSGFIVTERLIGCTLRDLLDQRGPGRPEEVADFLLQAGSALGAAHRAGLVHRDLKPENFFVETRSDPWRHVILDFGLAKPLEADTGMTQTGMVLGTPNYMAPEQLLGRTVDARSDLYALAAIAFEVLTGRRLVRASTLAEVAFEVTREAPPALREVLPEASAAAEEAFFAALAKAPDMRPADAEGWSRALSVLLAPMPSRLPGWRGLPSGKESLPPGNSGLPTVDLPRA